MNHSVFEAYYNKFSIRDAIIKAPVNKELGLVVVIPSYNESCIKDAVLSLNNAKSPSYSVEVIVVVNQSKNTDVQVVQRNVATIETLKAMADNLWFRLHVVEEMDLPIKHAGVGLARKIGLDEGLRRLSRLGIEGVLVCFDADSMVAPNYFIELEKVFSNGAWGCNIYFEHALNGPDSAINRAVTDYELFLRYYNLAMNYIGVPYAHFTVGSSMAFTCGSYMRVGGMNKRKAGEDFYFLHKIIQLGNFKEVTSTTVFPSSRCSDRVPFGTGKAIATFVENNLEQLTTYPFFSFIVLKEFIEKLRNYDLTNWPKEVSDFLPSNFTESLLNVRNNAKSIKKYISSSLQLFNAFQALKFLHFMRDKYGEVNLNDAVIKLMRELGHKDMAGLTNTELLIELRKIDKDLLYRCR